MFWDVDYDGLGLWVVGMSLLLSYSSIFMNQKYGFLKPALWASILPQECNVNTVIILFNVP